MSRYICIDDTRNEASVHFQNWVEKDKEYTVRRIEGSLDGTQRVLLNEVRNKPIFIAELGGHAEPGFSVERFRLLDDNTLQEVVEVEEEMYV